MLMPEAWEQNAELSAELRDFYKYHSCVVEPWDGPAAIVFSDGRYVGATLDRNGLRPARYKITRDGLIVFGSEAGILQLHDSDVIEKGRLGPGRMIAVDTKRGVLLRDADIKRQLATAQPWGSWLAQHMVEYVAGASRPCPEPTPERLQGRDAPATESGELLRRQKMNGYTFEDLNRILHPMIKTGKEAVGSMGDDTPLAVLSGLARPLHHFFKQRFAQVTNPPIDPIREASAMSLYVNLGRGRSLLEETEEHASMLRLPSPFMTPAMFAWLEALDSKELRVGRVPALWNPREGAKGLQDGLDRICREAERQIDWGCSILVLSDRVADDAMAPVPALLATGALHHHLIRVGRRSRASIVVESGEVRDTHLFAALLGYGASAVYPWLVFGEVAALARTPDLLDGIDAAKAEKNVAKAFEDGLLKIMSKMGISTLPSYIGAQVFEAIGLAAPLVDMAFAGTPSRVGRHRPRGGGRRLPQVPRLRPHIGPRRAAAQHGPLHLPLEGRVPRLQSGRR
jgi:hypothetical protein